MKPPADLVPIPEAAQYARLNVETIRRWARAGIIDVWGHENARRVSLSQVLPHVVYRRGDTPNPTSTKWANRRKPAAAAGQPDTRTTPTSSPSTERVQRLPERKNAKRKYATLQP